MKTRKRGSYLLGKYKVISVSNQVLGYGQYGNFLIDPLKRDEKLIEVKKRIGIEEIMYVTTSNRELFVLFSEEEIDTDYLNKFFNCFKDTLSATELSEIKSDSYHLSGRRAISHVLCVASTMDSRGYIERGIVKAFINSLEMSNHADVSGNGLTLLIDRAAETANMVFTKTDILKNRPTFDPTGKVKYGINEAALHKNKWVKAIKIVEEYVNEFETSIKGMRKIKSLEEYAAA
ncbi:MAG: hypothetical protein HRT72_12885 [Flavobacteriales bacterium]|nr:hypothetical protein [Flavobacteriales bacterium]